MNIPTIVWWQGWPPCFPEMQDHSRRNILSNIVYLLSGSLVAQLASAVTLFLTARALGLDNYGIFAACFALVRIASIFFALGTDTWVLRESNLGHFHAGQVVRSSLYVKVILGSIWVLLLFLLSSAVKIPSYPVIMVSLAAIAVWLDSLYTSFETGFKAVLRNHKNSAINTLAALALMALTILIMHNGEHDPRFYTVLRIIISAGSIAVGFFWSRSEFRMEHSKAALQKMLHEFKPYMVSDALTVIYLSADVVIINLMLGKTSTGIYSPATNIISTLFIIPQALQAVMLPVLTRQISQQDGRQLKTIRGMVLSFILVGAGLWLVTALLAYPAVWVILGKEYLASSNILVILAAILFFKCGSFAMATVLIAVNWQKQRLIGQALSAFTNVALNLIIIRKFGITGVAWVYVFSEAVLLVSYMILVEKWRKQALAVQSISPVT